jgi:hypothetical protein
MDDKINQHIHITFCVKLGKSATKTIEMLCEAFEEHSFSRTAVSEWHSRLKAGRVSAKVMNVQSNEASAKQKMLKKFKNSFMKTIVVQSMNSQTPLGLVKEFAR